VRTISTVTFVGVAQFGFRLVSERDLWQAASGLRVGFGFRWGITALATSAVMSIDRLRARAMFEICLSVLFPVLRP